jgi:hypothetical protein
MRPSIVDGEGGQKAPMNAAIWQTWFYFYVKWVNGGQENVSYLFGKGLARETMIAARPVWM